jgi:HK97 family phage major capsid protein
VRRIPGNGTTVYVPYDNEADGEFITKAEATTFDRDAPALAKATMTLVKYTKYIELSDELMQDTGVNLMGFLTDWIARGQAKTYNDLLLTAVATSGTAFKTTAASTTLAFGEIEDTALNDTSADYLDDAGSVAWVMRPSTYNAVSKIVSASPRMYGTAEGRIGANGTRELLGYPVFFSNKAAAIASTAKVAYFGNWNYVGWREGNGLVLLRDPYSAASSGQLRLWLYFRTVFTPLQAAAIGYMKMKT